MIILGRGILGKALITELQDTRVLSRKEFDLSWNIDEMYFAIKKVLPTVRESCIINAAGYTDVDKSEIEKDLALQINAYGPYRLATICKDLGVKLIHISTNFVFDGKIRHSDKYTEYSETNPINWYGKTKLLAELMVRNSGCKHVIIRTGWLYDNYSGLIPKLILAIKGSKEPTGVKDQRITPTSAYDLAKQINLIYNKNLVGTFHASNRGEVTPCDLIEMLAKEVLQTECDPWRVGMCSFKPAKARRPQDCVLENFNLKALGLDIMPDWKDSAMKAARKYNEKER